jgi:hydrogenase maturation protein HypF
MLQRAGQPSCTARRLTIVGQVQAVGFRPFVFRLAHRLGLVGWVRNRTGEVEVLAQGRTVAIDEFERALIDEAPPLARPRIASSDAVQPTQQTAFEILPSEQSAEPRISVPPDYFACDECLAELTDPADRRFRYPFINCTQCGPRYTLIRGMPYDRAQTTMADFRLCEDCQREYEEPLDRRFHAEPVACPACGPRLELRDGESEPAHGAGALTRAVAALQAGRIVAVKGVGGYHLACDARDAAAVRALRHRKHRPDKPLAVMCPRVGYDGLDWVRRCAMLTADTGALVAGPSRPIVLLPATTDSPLAVEVAPGLREIGVFLPYSPLHELLLANFGAPLVMTSGNLTGEPVLTDNQEAARRLKNIADVFVHHDRPIERPADDPVWRPIAGQPRPLRLGRGNAPTEFELPWSLPAPLLAVGGHLKNTVALAWGSRAVVSPHIGDMDGPRSLRVFEQVTADLQRLYDVRAAALVCDAHPGYATHRWAMEHELPATKVWHHHAHASALAAESPEVKAWLTFTWDGVGLGEDGTLWGGEALLGRPGAWRRVASMRSFRLPGGDRAAREPWRSAAAIAWECGHRFDANADRDGLVRRAWERDLNCHRSSAAGRLFDAAAALLLDLDRVSYEGQGPMMLEACCADDGPEIALPIAADDSGVLRIDWAPLLPMLLDTSLTVPERATGFHLSLAGAVAKITDTLRAQTRVDGIGLTGGVFQNRLLAQAVLDRLAGFGIPVMLPARLPCNDGGLSFGQIVEASGALAGDRSDS